MHQCAVTLSGASVRFRCLCMARSSAQGGWDECSTGSASCHLLSEGLKSCTYTDKTGATKETDHDYMILFGYDRKRKTQTPTTVMFGLCLWFECYCMCAHALFDLCRCGHLKSGCLQCFGWLYVNLDFLYSKQAWKSWKRNWGISLLA